MNFQELAYLTDPSQSLYFVGIGGISMSGLAELARSSGHRVGGSDLSENARISQLRELGALIFPLQVPENIDQFSPAAIIYSAAIDPQHPELRRGREKGIPVIERSDWLGLLNRQYQTVVNVAGTNGKSTTTAMVSQIALDAHLDPTIHLGAEYESIGSTVHAGSRQLMISEACEFHRSFLSFYSTMAAVLNLGHDHIDCFPEMKDVVDVFAEFLAKLEPGSRAILPSFDPYLQDLLAAWKAKNPSSFEKTEHYYFGYADDPEPEVGAQRLTAENLDLSGGFARMDLSFHDEYLGRLELSVPGRFNAENAMAALLMGLLLGAEPALAMKSLADFKGVEGRFTLCGYYRGAQIVNDYAHHPDSVKKTLETAHQINHQKIYACFQPITFSRAEGLAEGFVSALQNEDPAILLEVFDDREKNHHFSSREIAEAIVENGGHALFIESCEELETYLRERLKEGDMALLMGQSIRNVGDRLAARHDHYHNRLTIKNTAESANNQK